MIILENYLLWTLAIAKPSKDLTRIPRMAANLKAHGHIFTTEIDQEVLNACLYNKIAAIAQQGICPRSSLPLVKKLINNVLTCDKLLPDYCFIAIKQLIIRYNLNILQVFKPYLCKKIEDELKYIISINSLTIVVYLAKLIVIGVDSSFFDAYDKKDYIFNLIVERSLFGLYAGSAEHNICIEAAMIISQYDGFQLTMPRDQQQATTKLNMLLQREFPLRCFNKFPVNLIKYHWRYNRLSSDMNMSFEITLINAGRSPVELGVECVPDNNKLLAIAKLYNYDALLAMFNLIYLHGYNLPKNIMLMYLTNIQKMYDASELPQMELFLLAYILQTGLMSDDLQLMPDAEQAAELYNEAITRYQDTRAMINLGQMYQYGQLKPAVPDYVAAVNYYNMAVSTNDDPIAKSNLEALKSRLFI